MMNLLDLLLVLLFVLALLYGALRGFFVLVVDTVGICIGFAAGFLLAPLVVDWTGAADPRVRQSIAFAVVSSALVIAPVGILMLTRPLWRGTVGRWRGLRNVDSVAGSMVAGLVALGAAWLFAVSFNAGPSQDLSRLIQQSSILRQLDSVAPEPPDLVTRVEDLLASRVAPNLFVGLEPDLPAALVPADGNAALPGVTAAAASVVRVSGPGCGGVITGSGFVANDGLVVTNAHVIAGVRSLTVTTASGKRLSASVRLFDPDTDIAILTVQGLTLTPLRIAESKRGTQGAVIGYPGGGPEKIVTAVVNGALSANGRDIFGTAGVTRDVVVLQGEVRPGNSGGPLVDQEGRVIGLIYAASISHPGQGFALSPSELESALAASAKAPAIDARVGQCVH